MVVAGLLLGLLHGGRLLTGSRHRQRVYRVRDPFTAVETSRQEGDYYESELTVSPGGRYVASREKGGEVVVVEARGGRHLRRYAASAAVGVPVLADDGQARVGLRSRAEKIEVWRWGDETGPARLVLSLTKEDLPVSFFPPSRRCFSPDGRWFVAPAKNGDLRRWGLAAGRELPPLRGRLGAVWDVVWSPDGRIVGTRETGTTAGGSNAVVPVFWCFWDVKTGVALPYLDTRHDGMPTDCHLFSRDSRTLLTTDLSGTISLWELSTGKKRGVLRGHLPGEIGALAETPDGRVLVSGGHDSQVLVWDLTGRMPDGRWQAARHTPEELRRLWEALAGDDAAAVYRAMWALTADPSATTAFLRERLKPVPRPDAARLARLLADLDGDEFAARQRAAQELETFGGAAASALREALAKATSAEARRALRTLLDKADQPVPGGRALQEVRAVEALGHAEGAEARALLEALAGGAPGARLTEDAQAALRRVTR